MPYATLNYANGPGHRVNMDHGGRQNLNKLHMEDNVCSTFAWLTDASSLSLSVHPTHPEVFSLSLSIHRISRIRRWCHWNRRHMAAMMLVSSPAGLGHIYSVVFMNKTIYHMPWAMRRALERAYRRVNKTKQRRCVCVYYFYSQFVWIVCRIRQRQIQIDRHNKRNDIVEFSEREPERNGANQCY